jgi:hypothetical protein
MGGKKAFSLIFSPCPIWSLRRMAAKLRIKQATVLQQYIRGFFRRGLRLEWELLY